MWQPAHSETSTRRARKPLRIAEIDGVKRKPTSQLPSSYEQTTNGRAVSRITQPAIVFRSLYRVGYDGPIIIEHEDRDFEETEELVKRGFLIARDVLAPYCH